MIGGNARRQCSAAVWRAGERQAITAGLAWAMVRVLGGGARAVGGGGGLTGGLW